MKEGSSVGDGDEKSPKGTHSLYVLVVCTFTPLFCLVAVGAAAVDVAVDVSLSK